MLTLSPAPTAPAARIWPALCPEADPVHLVAEWAIRLPDSTWWRDTATEAADPEGTEPTIYRTRIAAEAARIELITTACGRFGARRADYRPRLLRRAVRATATGQTLGALGNWQAPTATAVSA